MRVGRVFPALSAPQSFCCAHCLSNLFTSLFSVKRLLEEELEKERQQRLEQKKAAGIQLVQEQQQSQQQQQQTDEKKVRRGWLPVLYCLVVPSAVSTPFQNAGHFAPM